MGQLTQTTAQVQVILDDADAANVGKTSLTDSTDTTAVAVRKSGFYSLGASSSNAPSTDRAILISAVRDTTATGEIRYGQVAITESNGMWWNRDDGGTLGTWYEAVSTAGTQTLTNKTLTSPVLTTPQINDTSANHQYVFAVSELAADRTVTLPLLTGNDTFVFEAHTQTLTNKTLTSPVLNTSVSGSAVLDEDDMSSNSATKLATQQSIKAYVDSQVGSFDTLAEVLAQGNTTGGTDISVSTGDDITFADSSKAIFGAGSDLQIYHDGSNSYVQDAGSGYLVLGKQDTGTAIQNSAGQNLLITSANDVTLGYQNSAKLVTTSSGADISGTLTADGLTIDGTTTLNTSSTTFVNLNYFGANKGKLSTDGVDLIIEATANLNAKVNSSNRLKIEGNGDISFYEDTGTTAKLFWDASQEQLNIDSSQNDYAQIITQSNADGSSGGLYIQKTGGGARGLLVDTTGSYSAATAAFIGHNVGIGTSSPSEQLHVYSTGTAKVEIEGGANGDAELLLTETGSSGFSLKYDGGDNKLLIGGGTAGTFTTRMSVDRDSGNVGIGTSSPNATLKVQGPVDTATISTSSTPAARINNGGAISNWIGANGYNYGYIQSIQDDGTNNLKSLALQPLGGSVGIGLTSPARSLDVNGAIRVANANAVEWGGANEAIVGDTGGALIYKVGGAEIMRNTSTGLGIGTSNPSATLALDKDTGAQHRALDLENNSITYSMYVDQDNSSTNSWSLFDTTNSQTALRYLPSSSGYWQFYTNDSERMRIGSDGSILKVSGSNATLPAISTSLIEGEVRGSENAVTAQDSGILRLSAGGGTTIGVKAGIDIFRGATDGSLIRMFTSGQECIRLDQNGNLLVNCTGISTDAPNVDGSLFTGGGNLKIRKGTASFQWVQFYGTGVASPIGSISNVSNTSTSYNTSSDQRLKSNIVDAPSAADDIDAIQVRSWDWKADGSHQKYGMVAQELVTVAPEAVHQPEDPQEMMGVDYSKLVPMLVKEIQQLRARVAQLEGAK